MLQFGNCLEMLFTTNTIFQSTNAKTTEPVLVILQNVCSILALLQILHFQFYQCDKTIFPLARNCNIISNVQIFYMSATVSAML